MPASYSFHDGVMRLSLVGETELPHLKEVLESALSDSECPGCPALLTDVRRSTSVGKRTPEEMRRAVELFRPHRGRFSKRAIVATEGLRYGMMRMASAFSDPDHSETVVFLDDGAALAWLKDASGRPPEDYQAEPS